AEHLIFGESYPGYLWLVSLLPFLVFALFRRFLPLRWALALTLVFAAVPVGALFGSSLVQYIKWAARGFADPAAYIFFLAAFVLLLGALGEGPRDRFARAFGAGLLFALALFVRPNIAPAASILLAGAGLAALAQRQFRRVAGLAAGFAAGPGMAPAHWAYGGAPVFVPPPRRASAPVADAAVGLSRGARRARAFELRRRIRGARAAADYWLARRPVRIRGDGAAQRGGDSRARARRAVARGRSMAAADRLRHVGAALCRALLSRRRPLPLSDLAAHAAGGGGVGARRRARDRPAA